MLLDKKDYPKDKYTFQDLLDIMYILNGKDGCPWDIVQTHESLIDNLIEETYETQQAILQKDRDNLIEELGDILMQPLFHGIIAERNGTFDIDTIIDGLAKKLVNRHSYVFSTDIASDSTQALNLWVKNKNKTPYQSLSQLPQDLPLDIKIKKLQKALQKQNIDCPKQLNLLEQQLREFNKQKENLNNTINDMIELLK